MQIKTSAAEAKCLCLSTAQTAFSTRFKEVLSLFFILGIFYLPLKIYAQNPTITSFEPDSGAVGSVVTITGTNLNNPTFFTIGGVSALTLSNDGNTLVGIVMPGAVTAPIIVTTVGGTALGGVNFTVIESQAPIIQQGNKLLGSDTSINPPRQGWSVAVSANGTTAVVGAPYHGDYGGMWVYTRIGSVWTQQGNLLVGTGSVGNPLQGYAVGISADGNTAIMSGHRDNSDQGAAWIFTRSNGIWTQQGNKLVATGGIGASNIGEGVAISGDGNTAMIGTPEDNNNIGAVWVFTRSNGSWTQEAKLVGTGNIGMSGQGRAISLSVDGNTAIIGGNGDNNYQGAAWVFTRSNGLWLQEAKLIATGNIGAANQGNAVSLSADGNTALVTGHTDNNYIGAAWIFTRSFGNWTQQGNKIVGTGNTGQSLMGWSAKLSSQGNTMVLGGPNDNANQGAAWVFTKTNGVWSQQGNKLVGTGGIGNPKRGESVALSADGNILLVGGSRDNSENGAVWAYSGCNFYADAGADKTACGTNSVFLEPGSGGIWMGGVGTWTGNQYTPHISEIGSTVILTRLVINGNCSATDNVNVPVITAPPTGTIAASNNNPCASTYVTLTAAPAAGYTASEYLWYMNGILVNSGISPTYTVGSGPLTTNNIYTVRMAYSGLGCFTAPAPNTWVTTHAVYAFVTIAGPPTFCANTPSTLNATAGMSNYVWKQSATIVQSGASASYTPTATGNYYVTITDTNGCSRHFGIYPITVNPLPMANAGLDRNVCVGTSVQIGTTTNPYYTYSWTPSIGLSNSTIANPMASPLSNTSYTVTTTHTSTGCFKKDTVVLTSLASPPIPSLSSTTTPVCKGEAVSITPSSTGATSIDWYKNGAFLNNKALNFVKTVNVVSASPDNYSIKAKAANGCVSGFSNTLAAWVKDAVTPTITSTPAAVGNLITVCVPGGTSGSATLTASSTQASASYSWKVAGNYVNGANTNTYTQVVTTTANNKAVSVEATYPNGCVKSSVAKNVRLKTSGCVPKLGSDKDEADMLMIAPLNIYPNPTRGVLNVDITNSDATEGSLILYNTLGQVVAEQSFSVVDGQASLEIDLHSMATGVYSLVFHTDKGDEVRKIVKE